MTATVTDGLRGVSSIAIELGIGETCVRRWLDRLGEAGVLTVHRVPRSRTRLLDGAGVQTLRLELQRRGLLTAVSAQA